LPNATRLDFLFGAVCPLAQADDADRADQRWPGDRGGDPGPGDLFRETGAEGSLGQELDGLFRLPLKSPFSSAVGVEELKERVKQANHTIDQSIVLSESAQSAGPPVTMTLKLQRHSIAMTSNPFRRLWDRPNRFVIGDAASIGASPKQWQSGFWHDDSFDG